MHKLEEIRQLSVTDLKARAKDLNEDIFKTRMQDASGTVKDKHAIVKKRRALARVLTVMNEKGRRS